MPNKNKLNSLIERLYYYAETTPDHQAIVALSLTLNYAELAQLVLAQVKVFNDEGITRDSIIGIKCNNDTQHLVACLAAVHIGATSCTISTHEKELSQAAEINHCGITHVIDKTLIVNPKPVDDEKHKISLQKRTDEARLLFSTSGTTGKPKLVAHHDTDIVMQAHRHVESKHERFACIASMEHNFAKRHRLYCVAIGATNVFIDTIQQPLVKQCLDLNVNVMHVSAFQAQELLAEPDIALLSDIRLKLGGSHVPVSLRQRLRNNITHQLQAGYGTTETGAIAFTDPDDTDAGESVGQPLPGIEVRTVSPEKKPLKPGMQGELSIRCDGLFREYLGLPELTATRVQNNWFYTGDIGYLDKHQRIHLCGRTDDMFVFNSMNIYPQDIESKICEYPDVSDAAVLPKTSSIHGNIPVALVVFSAGTKPDLTKLKKFVRERVGIRSPRKFTLVDQIPRNSAGKVLRNEVKSLSSDEDQIRCSIIQSLEDANLKDHLKPSLIKAFEDGEKDISLREIGMSSMARMELLVMLETEYNTVIMPEEFSQLESLNEYVINVLKKLSKKQIDTDKAKQNKSKKNDHATSVNIKPAHEKDEAVSYTVRFFQRIFRYCHTVAHLNKALSTLEYRLTPNEIVCLRDGHSCNKLIPSNTAEKFSIALNDWFETTSRMMSHSGKTKPEQFVSRKVNPNAMHYIGPGSVKDKTLLICFAARGTRGLMIPNAVLMQHIDATRYDLLIIAEPLGESYRLGVPFLGNSVTAVAEWIARQDFVNNYRCVRTIGTSAGSYPAVICGYRLGAEMAVSVGGRFPSERYLIRILKRIFTTWRAKRNGQYSRVLLSFDADKTRDRNYAKIMKKFYGCSFVAVSFTNEVVGHSIFMRLADRGELSAYLSHTLFTEISNKSTSAVQQNVTLNLPDNYITPYCGR